MSRLQLAFAVLKHTVRWLVATLPFLFSAKAIPVRELFFQLFSNEEFDIVIIHKFSVLGQYSHANEIKATFLKFDTVIRKSFRVEELLTVLGRSLGLRYEYTDFIRDIC